MSKPTSSGEKSKTPIETGVNTARSPSLESTASVSSGTTGRFTSGKTDTAEQNTITTYGRNLNDVVCALIWCPKHKKVALSRFSEKKGFFFPAAPVKTGRTWFDTITPRLKEVLRVVDGNGNGKVKPYLGYNEPKL